MPWFRVDDSFHCHPKVVAAGNAACGLFVRLGSYCAQQLTDGFIPRRIVHAYGTRSERDRLLDLHLIELHGDGYVMPDYLDFNPSAAEVWHIRNTRSEAGKRGGIASGKSRRPEANNEPNAEANASRFGSSKNEPHPIPSHPSTTRTHTSSSSTDSPPDDDDDYSTVLGIIADAKVTEYHPTRARAYAHKVRVNTNIQDGDHIRQELANGLDPEHVALMILGYGTQATQERTEQPWCNPDCDCGGDGWTHTPRGLAPCPNRTKAHA